MFEIYFTAINLLTFIVWGIDKMKAAAGQWRVPEKTLFLLIAAGGGLGAMTGKLLFRHKTRKPVFQAVAVASSILYLIVWAKISY